MTPRRRRLAGLLLAALFTVSGLAASGFVVSGPAHAAPPGPGDADSLRRIEAYLNGLTTLEARFLQVSSGGAVAEGTIQIARPGRLRLEYDPPNRILMVANLGWLIYVDWKLEQVSHIPVDQTPAQFFLQDTISLTGALVATDIERRAGVIRLTLVRRDEPEAGALILAFSEAPLTLRQWTVIDAQGVQTRISLDGLRTGVAFAPDLFVFNPPSFNNSNP